MGVSDWPRCAASGELRDRLRPVIAFMARRPRLVIVVQGLAVLAAAAGLARADQRELSPVVFFGLLVLAVALLGGWCFLALRARGAGPSEFLLGSYRGRPAYVTRNSPQPLAQFTMFFAGDQVENPNTAHGWSLLFSPVVFVPLFLVLWLLAILQPSNLRLTREGIVCRRSPGGQTIPWNALYPGDGGIHHDQKGAIWLLAGAAAIPERTIDRKSWRPEAPPGFRWIQASALTAVDPAFLDAAIGYFHRTASARAAIGTAAGLQTLRGTA